MNVLTIAGNIGRDAKLNSVQTANGPVSVANFSVAVQTRNKDAHGKNISLWFDCALWGVRADKIASYLTAGSKVTVTGEVGVGSFNDNSGSMVPKLTVRVNDVTLQGSNQSAGASGAAPAAQRPQQPQQQNNASWGKPQGGPAASPSQPQVQPPMNYDDEIPF